MLARAGLHAANGFMNFREAEAIITRVGSFVTDVCALVLVPLLFITISWENDVSGTAIVSFSGTQQYFWLGWIILYTAGYFYAINQPRLLSPLGEAVLGVLAGAGILINLLIAWPIVFEDSFWLSVIGNFPIILALLFLLTRRQALLDHSTQEILDQRRYDNIDVLDYLPSQPRELASHNYQGNLGQLLRQPFPVKMLLYLLGGGGLILATAFLATVLGVDFTVLPV